ncbi:MAG: Nramp family divalent metal transporter, partial [Actinomycetota bacterium]
APQAPTTDTYPLGVSRPPLGVDDLPEPEEVFHARRIGRKEIVTLVLGPSLIALGISIGSGEWLLGPLNVGTLGFVGIGWIITISALLQTFYNIEFARYVVATGEVPIVGFARVPPGAALWVPFSLLTIFFAFIWGGWAKAAAQGLFALLNGRIPGDGDGTTVTLFAILLLLVVMVLTMVSRKITRGLELANLTSIAIQLAFLLIIDLFIVPFSVWWDGFRGLITPALPPEGSDATLLGGLAGFTALASGLNWYVMNHYRDKGYGMGYRTGFIAGLRGEKREVAAVGVTFPDDERNTALWKRWMGYLKLDMWVIFFGGAMIGMFLPIILMRQMVLLSGQKPTQANVPTFVANILDQEYGRWMFYIALFVGFLILFDTQLGIFEALVRNTTDAANMSPRLQQAIAGDPRRFYFPFMFVLTAVIGLVLQFLQPARLILISANMSNFGALIFPFFLMYLNSKLPRAARPKGWVYVILVLNFLFFGFFFLNFVFKELTGDALVTF